MNHDGTSDGAIESRPTIRAQNIAGVGWRVHERATWPPASRNWMPATPISAWAGSSRKRSGTESARLPTYTSGFRKSR